MISKHGARIQLIQAGRTNHTNHQVDVVQSLVKHGESPAYAAGVAVRNHSSAYGQCAGCGVITR